MKRFDGLVTALVLLVSAAPLSCGGPRGPSARRRASQLGFYLPSQSRFTLYEDGVADPKRPPFQFGNGYEVPLSGDWDGDGYDTIGLFLKDFGAFVLTNEPAGGSGEAVVVFGAYPHTVFPVAGDWDGDGIATVGVYDPEDGVFLMASANGPKAAITSVAFGPKKSRWLPVVGDWDGDGGADLGLYEPGASTFHLRLQNGERTFAFGPANGLPIAGDWTGSGRSDVGVFDRVEGAVYLRVSPSQAKRISVGSEWGVPLSGRWRPPL